jgi:hypothetical protein
MTSTLNHNRNGTSQSQRLIDALSPGYFLLEERSIADLILYAKKHAEILHYFNLSNEIDGIKANWSAFLDGDPKEMADFLNAPDFFDAFPEKKAKYGRPHLILFLVFLKLLQESHARINSITKKQLDFYYREALRFSPKKSVPDRVHVLANIDAAETQVLIPKGTLLQAGADGRGNSMQYATDQDLVVNHARIARLMSLYVEKQVTDIPLLRLQGEGKADRGFLSILQLTYRKAGTTNSPRSFPANQDTDRPLDQNLIGQLDELGKTITQTFHLRIASFQRLMQDYHFWESDNLWNTINNFLLITFNNLNNKNKKGSEIFTDPKDFNGNFEKALGFTVDGLKKNGANVFDGIPDVNNLYDLYDNYLRFPDDVKILNFISDKFKQGEKEFMDFMEARNQTLGLMKNINQSLKSTAQKSGLKSESWDHFQYKKDETLALCFSKYLGITSLKNDQDLITFEQDLNDLETYFKMNAEDYFFIRNLYLPENFPNVPVWKWQKADSLLIQAYRVLSDSATTSQNVSRPLVPEIIRWKNIYAAPDTTLLQLKSSAQAEPFPRWKGFGAKPFVGADPKIHFAADLGWAISSPVLNLSEGIRELKLKLTFRKEEFENQRKTLNQYLKNWNPEKGPYPFHVEVSTEKGWVNFSEWTSFQIVKNEPAMEIGVRAKEDVEPFAPLADDVTPFPWLRLIINKNAFGEEEVQVYELFKEQFLEQLELGIKVTGLTNLLIQNKEGNVDPKKPFDIFGNIPEIGDRLYITHPELASQKLDSLTVNLEWKNLPAEGLTKYYEEYTKAGVEPPVTDASFQAHISLIEAYQQLELFSQPQALFGGDGKTTQTIQSANIPDKFKNTDNAYVRKPFAKTDSEVIDSDRYLEIELQPRDFLHNQYAIILQKLVNKSLVESFTADGKYKPVPLAVLPEPYKPTLKSIRLDYETSLKTDRKTELNSTEDKAVQIEPFGLHFLPDNEESVPFLPEVEKEGTLFIGLENLNPPENVSFLFQLAEGSADPDLDPSPVIWSYLSGNDWIELEKEQLLTDTTGGLLSSGLIQIHIPENASLHHRRMPDGLYWLRAEVDRFSESLSDCIDIRTQAVSATWIDEGKSSDHLEQPLNAGTISQPVEHIAGLSSFTQPFSSFFGKAAEGDDQLYRRASELLRHKQRALTTWDYENLVLEEFPDIFRVKAISADLCGDNYEPGSVRIVVIPDIRKRKPFDPFEPKVPVSRLREIQQFLQKRAPAFARVHVQNPRFMYLQLRILVRFNDMNNFGFFAGKLHQELLEYLAPWAFDESVDIMFGGKIYPSVIVDFIENRPYVDYIDRPALKLQERKSDGTIRVLEKQPDDEDYLNITEPDVVIVSAHQHIIESLALPEETSKRIRQGIGFAKIEFDFQIP